MKNWRSATGRSLLAGAVWLLCWAPASEWIAVAAAQTNRRARVSCTNDSGDMRCTRDGIEIAAAGPAPAPDPGAAAADVPSARSAAAPPREVFVAVKVNGRVVQDFARLLQFGARFYASKGQLAAWGLKPPAVSAAAYLGVDYFPIDVAGITYRLDEREQALLIVAPPAAFNEQVRILTKRDVGPALAPAPGVFLNHDVQLTRSAQGFGLAGLGEVGIFSRAGVFTTRLLGRDIAGATSFTRLDTQFVRDFPSRMASLTLGDSVSAGSSWGRQVYYAGVRWASKFSTQPDFVPFILPSVQGEAARPSVVDIYVDNVRAGRQEVDAGPFAIHNIPVMTGQGELRMVVTDVMGRQHVLTQSYLSSRELLRRGINEYAYEAGVLRTGFGLSSGGYHSLFFSGTQRRGITDSLTVDWRAELLARSQTAGAGADIGILRLGTLGGSVAFSHSAAGLGALANASLQHQRRSFGYSATLQAATRRFSQMGLLDGERAARLIARAAVTRSLGPRLSLSFGYLRQQGNAVNPRPLYLSEFTYGSYTASASVRVSGSAFLALAANYSPGLRQGTSASVTLVLPLSARRSIVSDTEVQQGRVSAAVDLTQQLPVGNGYGYRVRTTSGASETTEAGLWLQNGAGNYSLEAGRYGSDVSMRLGERGSLVWVDHTLARARWLDDSFAVVEVPGNAGVNVVANHQAVARTDRRGVAVVPRLAAYQRNSISLDDTGVPLEMSMDFSEKTVVPSPRSAVVVKFAAAKMEGAILVLVDERGEALPVGTEVYLNDDVVPASVALHGEALVPTISFPARVKVRGPAGSCEARIAPPPGSEPMPRIGPVVCRAR